MEARFRTGLTQTGAKPTSGFDFLIFQAGGTSGEQKEATQKARQRSDRSWTPSRNHAQCLPERDYSTIKATPHPPDSSTHAPAAVELCLGGGPAGPKAFIVI